MPARKLLLIQLVSGLLLLQSASVLAATDKRPIVIAHRGASGYRPEHTLAAYELAINLGADFVEPDLVSTKDGALVARHENEISGTTDVSDHPEFANRRCKKKIDGETLEGWFTEDFTLAELKTLKARERLPKFRVRNMMYNDRYQIPTLQEIIDLVARKNKEQNRKIGIYPETKHPSYFSSIGLSLEEPLVKILKTNGYKENGLPIFIQSFEPASLKKLKTLIKVPLIQLIDEEGKPYDFVLQNDPRTCADMLKPDGLKEIASYAQGIGPNKNTIIPRDKQGKLLQATTLVADAHKQGLKVHPWTFRNENNFQPLDFRKGDQSDPCVLGQYGDAFAEYKLFFDQGIDGLFSEQPDTALEAIKANKKAN